MKDYIFEVTLVGLLISVVLGALGMAYYSTATRLDCISILRDKPALEIQAVCK